jgi:hypothetical protein
MVRVRVREVTVLCGDCSDKTQCDDVARGVVEVLERACALSDTVPSAVAAILSAVLLLVQSAMTGQLKGKCVDILN